DLLPDVVQVVSLGQGRDNGQGLIPASGRGGTHHDRQVVHGCDATAGHGFRVPKRPIKIRNEKRTKWTYQTYVVETSRVLLGEDHAGGGGLAARTGSPAECGGVEVEYINPSEGLNWNGPGEAFPSVGSQGKAPSCSRPGRRSCPGGCSAGRVLLPGPGRDPQHVQHHCLQGFAQLLVGQVDQIGQALRDEECGAGRESLGAGRVIAEDQGEATLAQCC